MHLVHSNPQAGHLAGQSTLEISDWPGMNTEVKNFCQHTVPLLQLPIIFPFESMGMALVGLKSAKGHEYIFVIMDYATCSPRWCPSGRPP